MDSKKILITVAIVIAVASICILLYYMLRTEKETYQFAAEKQELINPNKNKIEAPFVNHKYIREVDNRTETISFTSEGAYSYTYENETQVGSTKTCEYYTYDDITKSIKLVCFSNDDIITELKLVNATDTVLQIDFYGDIRTFERLIGE